MQTYQHVTKVRVEYDDGEEGAPPAPRRQKHPKDPRNRAAHRERGPAKYSFTLAEIAAACGAPVRALGRAKGFDAGDLSQLVGMVNRQRARRGLPVLQWEPPDDANGR